MLDHLTFGMFCLTPSKLEGLSQRLSDVLGSFCCWHLLPLRAYCLTIAVVGMVVMTADMYRVLADGAVLSDSVWPMRRSGEKTPISDESERDMKLISSVLEWTVYFCLFIGCQQLSPMFLLPWLLLRMFILVSAIIVSLVKILHHEPVQFSALDVVGQILAVHNLLYVSCLLRTIW